MLRAQVLLVVGLAIAIEIVRLRARERRTPPRFPSSAPPAAARGPVARRVRGAHPPGRRNFRELRDLAPGTRNPARALQRRRMAAAQRIHRSIVVRHLWRALETLAKGAVVVVDAPPQRWSKEIDAGFDDQGIDPCVVRPVRRLGGWRAVRQRPLRRARGVTGSELPRENRPKKSRQPEQPSQ